MAGGIAGNTLIYTWPTTSALQDAWIEPQTSTANKQMETGPVYKTQKARGLATAWDFTAKSGFGYKVAPIYGVFPHFNMDKIKKLFTQAPNQQIFARPCPTVPRHGFVESRVVANVEELVKVIEETLAQEPEGEVILMNKLHGKYSAILTAAGCVWATGNDGATSGKGEQRIVPAPSGNFDKLLHSSLGLPENAKDGVYIELVEHNGSVYVVQVRLGPPQRDSRSKRYVVAKKVGINQIIKCATEDLLLWDKELDRQKAGLASATLVHLPGHSLASHFAVQAIAKGFNVSVEDELPVQTGGTLEADTNSVPPMPPEKHAEMSKYLKAETTTAFWDFPREILLSVAVLHSMTYWGHEPWLLRLRARGIVAAARFALAACLGESRHLLRLTFESESGRKPKVPWENLIGGKIDETPDRAYVFTRALSKPWDECHKLANAAADDLWINGYGRVAEFLKKGNKLANFQVSFRGHRWEWAALEARDLIRWINVYIKNPGPKIWGHIVSKYNNLINAAHNGGYLLSKWVSPSLIDRVAINPALAFGYRQVMDIVWENYSTMSIKIPWEPLSNFDVKKMPDYVLVGKVMAHDNVVKKLVGLKLISGMTYLPPNTNCNCNGCMSEAYVALGMISEDMGYPAYVPPKMLHMMPQFETGAIINTPADYQEDESLEAAPDDFLVEDEEEEDNGEEEA